MLEQWGLRFGKGGETQARALVLLKDFLPWVTLRVTVRRLPDDSAPHTMIQYLADLSMIWALPADSPLVPAAGLESGQMLILSLCINKCPPEPGFPTAQPLPFSQETYLGEK